MAVIERLKKEAAAHDGSVDQLKLDLEAQKEYIKGSKIDYARAKKERDINITELDLRDYEFKKLEIDHNQLKQAFGDEVERRVRDEKEATFVKY